MKPITQSDLMDAVVQALQFSFVQRQKARMDEPSLPPTSGVRLKVLLAEDNAVNQRLAVRVLERDGHTPVVVNNGKEALAALEREDFDLVLMDVQMPEMGGFECTELIRQRERQTGKHIPIIAMTAHAMKGDEERCLASGMDGYICKPIQFDKLRAAIAQVCKGRSESQSVTADAQPETDRLFDREAMLNSLDGDVSVMQELLALFHEESARSGQDLREALAQQDGKRLARAAHSVKGAVSVLHADRLKVVAERLEQAGLRSDFASASASLAEFESLLGRLRKELAAALASELSPAGAET
jgi:CheY-like chemotaxis protein/HPt (histidine-containing phosphotransfer) domain-containing protein